MRVKITKAETDYGPRIAIAFPYSSELVAVARALKRRWWDAGGKCWLVPDDPDALDEAVSAFRAAGASVEVAPELERSARAVRAERAASLAASRAVESDCDVPTRLPLLPFQRAGVAYVDAHGGRALLADEMGVGKTAQALGWLVLRRERALPALVIAPAVVRVNWAREVAKFTDLKPLVVSSPSSLKSFRDLGVACSDRAEPGSDVVILNYDLLRVRDGECTINGRPLSEWAGFRTLVLDEAHAIKEPKSQRTKVALELARRIPHVLCLTGTPVLNRPREVWTITQAIDPTVFPRFFDFAREFCHAHKTRFGWDFSGASNTDKLARILRERVMIRREKTDVLSELPPRRRVTLPLALNGSLSSYKREAAPALERLARLKRERDELRARLDGLDEETRRKHLAEHAEDRARLAGLRGHMLSEIGRLRQAAGLAKVEAGTDYVLDTAEQAGKVIVFARHHSVVDAYLEGLARAGVRTVKIDGRDDAGTRQQSVDLFQEGDAQVAVVGIEAGGVGLNLHAASNVVFSEFPWRPADVDQAEARAWRLGQSKPVTSWLLLGLGTIDEAIARVIDAKRGVVNSVVDESDRTVEEDGILDAVVDAVVEGV